LNNEGTEVTNGLCKPDEGSLTGRFVFFFKMRTGCTPIWFTISKNCKPDGLVIRLSK